MTQESFTGRSRARKTPRSVRRAELTARSFILAGGVGTILAVSLIFVFLVWVVLPLFTSGSFEDRGAYPMAGHARELGVVGLAVDEYRLLAWELFEDGRIQVIRLDDGSAVEERRLFAEGARLTCSARTPDSRRFVVGFADGTARRGELGFQVGFYDEDETPEGLEDLAQGEVRAVGTRLVQRTPEGQLRWTGFHGSFEDPVQVSESALQRIDISVLPSDDIAFAALDADGKLAIYTTRERFNMMTGETTVDVFELALPYDPPAGRPAPMEMKLGGIGNLLYLVWEDGFLQRYDARRGGGAQVAETLDLTEGDARVTSARFLIGKTTLLVGDTSGTVGAWFPTKPDAPQTVDGIEFRRAHVLEGPDSAVSAIAASPRSRLAAVGYEDGSVRLFFVTGADLVGEVQAGGRVREVAVAPKEDGLVALTPTAVQMWDYDAAHPDAGLRTLFGSVWYESYAEPEFVWQSTGGTDDFESKLSLVPLVVGTLKATFYSMLIALPIALLAALFTSEFMRPSAKAPVKSVVEMMAGLPSVVLGFIAAIVVAPFVQEVLPATLSAFLTIPIALLLGARLWQMLPQRLALRWSGFPRLVGVAAFLAVGVLLAAAAGPVFQDVFFGGDLRGWLAGDDQGFGSLVGGWSFLLLPLGLLIAALLFARFVNPFLRTVSIAWPRSRCANVDVLRLGGLVVAGFLVTLLISSLLAAGGLDPRGSIVGTYTQRNALIVGFVMGFAIVPIIYTLAEDALSSVPSQLREGSLGSGATPWQTAMRIIVPTAMSGLFSAVMVGLGRAVGETMIVLMAAGGEPIMDWSMFNGFRTLSANIATELPEAVRDSTHYRTLFLAALVLFAMTFVINTAAEGVRRRFRRRYAEQL